MTKEIKIIDSCNPVEFTEEVNTLLLLGWEIISSDICATVNSEEYDYCSVYVVMLQRGCRGGDVNYDKPK